MALLNDDEDLAASNGKNNVCGHNTFQSSPECTLDNVDGVKQAFLDLRRRWANTRPIDNIGFQFVELLSIGEDIAFARLEAIEVQEKDVLQRAKLVANELEDAMKRLAVCMTEERQAEQVESRAETVNESSEADLSKHFPEAFEALLTEAIEAEQRAQHAHEHARNEEELAEETLARQQRQGRSELESLEEEIATMQRKITKRMAEAEQREEEAIKRVRNAEEAIAIAQAMSQNKHSEGKPLQSRESNEALITSTSVASAARQRNASTSKLDSSPRSFKFTVGQKATPSKIAVAAPPVSASGLPRQVQRVGQGLEGSLTKQLSSGSLTSPQTPPVPPIPYQRAVSPYQQRPLSPYQQPLSPYQRPVSPLPTANHSTSIQPNASRSFQWQLKHASSGQTSPGRGSEPKQALSARQTSPCRGMESKQILSARTSSSQTSPIRGSTPTLQVQSGQSFTAGAQSSVSPATYFSSADAWRSASASPRHSRPEHQRQWYERVGLSGTIGRRHVRASSPQRQGVPQSPSVGQLHAKTPLHASELTIPQCVQNGLPYVAWSSR